MWTVVRLGDVDPPTHIWYFCLFEYDDLEPKWPFFDWKRPSFGGFKPQNRGQTGSRDSHQATNSPMFFVGRNFPVSLSLSWNDSSPHPIGCRVCFHSYPLPAGPHDHDHPPRGALGESLGLQTGSQWNSGGRRSFVGIHGWEEFPLSWFESWVEWGVKLAQLKRWGIRTWTHLEDLLFI